MNKLFHTNKQSTQSGFTMLEVLVSLVVMSIGLLGLAGIQAASLSSNNTTYQRTQAIYLAYDMLDRMRSNFDGVVAGEYNSIVSSTSATDPNCFAVTGGCSIAQMADYDTFDWSQKLSSTLPAGQGKVTGTGANSAFTIVVMWDEERTGATGTDCGSDHTVDLSCMSITTQF